MTIENDILANKPRAKNPQHRKQFAMQVKLRVQSSHTIPKRGGKVLHRCAASSFTVNPSTRLGIVPSLTDQVKKESRLRLSESIFHAKTSGWRTLVLVDQMERKIPIRIEFGNRDRNATNAFYAGKPRCAMGGIKSCSNFSHSLIKSFEALSKPELAARPRSLAKSVLPTTMYTT